MIKVNVIINNINWFRYIKNPNNYLDQKIDKLNSIEAIFSKKKIKTEKEIYLGDIIINLNEIKNKKKSKDFKIEFDRLWIHGLVHLFGYDHKKDKDFLKMYQIEKKYFNSINV